MNSAQRLYRLCWAMALLAVANAFEYGPPNPYRPPPRYGYKKPSKIDLESILKSPEILTLLAGDKKTTTETPIELHINLTLPENGLPPTRLNLGNVAGYLLQKPGGPKPSRHTVLVDIKNQNKPYHPIPANVYQAALPQGSLLPPDRAAKCKNLISENCRYKCYVTNRSCKRLCNNDYSCLANCDQAQQTCHRVCDNVERDDLMNEHEYGKLTAQAKVVLLTKCLRFCKTNAQCIARCRDVCKDQLADYYPQPMPQYPSNYRGIDELAPQVVQTLKDDFLQLNSAGISEEMLASLLGLNERNRESSIIDEHHRADEEVDDDERANIDDYTPDAVVDFF